MYRLVELCLSQRHFWPFRDLGALALRSLQGKRRGFEPILPPGKPKTSQHDDEAFVISFQTCKPPPRPSLKRTRTTDDRFSTATNQQLLAFRPDRGKQNDDL